MELASAAQIKGVQICGAVRCLVTERVVPNTQRIVQLGQKWVDRSSVSILFEWRVLSIELAKADLMKCEELQPICKRPPHRIVRGPFVTLDVRK